jgi:hypothetical protein
MGDVRRILQKSLEIGRTCLRFICLCAHNFGSSISNTWDTARRDESGQDHQTPKRQLEGYAVADSSPVVSSDQNIRREFAMVWRAITRIEGDYSRYSEQANKGVKVVPLIILDSGKSLVLGARTGAFGHIRYYVEADSAVDTYVFNKAGLEHWKTTGETDQKYSGAFESQIHRESRHLPLRGTWYLVVDNPQSKPVAVRYSIGP